MRTHKVRMLAAVGAIVLIVAACSSDDDSSSTTSSDPGSEVTTTTASPDATGTIVDIAIGNEDFSTLVTALTEAELVETLSGPGPFTVFAPTNAAFAEIPEDQLAAILADKDQLTSILTYHVVAGKVMAADLEPSQQVPTVEGSSVDIQAADGMATINGCNIVATDIEASNGVVHVIDCVLVPEAS